MGLADSIGDDNAFNRIKLEQSLGDLSSDGFYAAGAGDERGGIGEADIGDAVVFKVDKFNFNIRGNTGDKAGGGFGGSEDTGKEEIKGEAGGGFRKRGEAGDGKDRAAVRKRIGTRVVEVKGSGFGNIKIKGNSNNI